MRHELPNQPIKRAIALSPSNSEYLSELGYIHQLEQEWKSAFEVFENAEAAAEIYSPEELKITELTRAKRGAGFVLVELDRLDEAEEKYLECLELDQNDKKAAGELRYVWGLRQKLNEERK